MFPITQNYYLSKLLFSPDAAQSSRILLSKEVHNAFDYHRCIRQFTNRTWQHALLRLTVLDEVPSTLPLNSKYLYFYAFFHCVLKHFHFIRRRDIQTYLFQRGSFRSIDVCFSAACCGATYETFCVIPNAHGCRHYDDRVILSEQYVWSPAASCAAASASSLCLLLSVTRKGRDKSHVTQLPRGP